MPPKAGAFAPDTTGRPTPPSSEPASPSPSTDRSISPNPNPPPALGAAGAGRSTPDQSAPAAGACGAGACGAGRGAGGGAASAPPGRVTLRLVPHLGHRIFRPAGGIRRSSSWYGAPQPEHSTLTILHPSSLLQDVSRFPFPGPESVVTPLYAPVGECALPALRHRRDCRFGVEQTSWGPSNSIFGGVGRSGSRGGLSRGGYQRGSRALSTGAGIGEPFYG